MNNILDCKFSTSQISKVYVSDITYIHTNEMFLYLTTVLGLYDHEFIGWNISDGKKTEETSSKTWEKIIKHRKLSLGINFNSDRGVKYAFEKCSDTLDSNKTITRSMGRKGNCWHITVRESLFKVQESERIYGNKLIFNDEMSGEVFEYIEIWSNRKPGHSFYIIKSYN